MTAVQMASGKRLGILVFNDEFNHIKFVVELLSTTFGYHPTQAHQCAEMIHNRGKYVVKSLPAKDKEKLEAYTKLLISNGVAAKIIPL